MPARNGVAGFQEICRENDCLAEAYPFATDHARVLYFRHANRQPDSPAHEDFRADVVVMSGLPGAGKDHWVREGLPDWPVISLDALRGELGIDPVIQGAADKLAGFRTLLAAVPVAPEQVCYVGDDLPDLPVLRRCVSSFSAARYQCPASC